MTTPPPSDDQPPEDEPVADSWSAASGGAGCDTELTRAEFRSRVRPLFRRYHPPDVKQMLRDHERAFIERCERLTPAQRYWLTVHLRHYERQVRRSVDDPAAAGLDPFTDAELRRLELKTCEWANEARNAS
ncbi:MAG: hypothetical protein IT480_01285 [Gammaproteobacteria bacterium]|nr:hypothetical protein [Gammaproteobacteria bacterium]